MCTLLVGLLYPDQLAKATEDGEDIVVASKAISVTNRSSFDSFISKARHLEREVAEGRSNVDGFERLQTVGEQLAEVLKVGSQHKWKNGWQHRDVRLHVARRRGPVLRRGPDHEPEGAGGQMAELEEAQRRRTRRRRRARRRRAARSSSAPA